MTGEPDQSPRLVLSPQAVGSMRFPLRDWWRSAFIDTVDHYDVLTRVIDDSSRPKTLALCPDPLQP